MFGGGQKSGECDVSGKSGDFKEHSFGRAIGVEAGAIFDAALAEPASEAQESGDGADVLLLVFREYGEGGVFELGLGAAMIAHSPSEDLPVLRSPGRRD